MDSAELGTLDNVGRECIMKICDDGYSNRPIYDNGASCDSISHDNGKTDLQQKDAILKLQMLYS